MRIIHPDDVTPAYLLDKRAHDIGADPEGGPNAYDYARAAAELHGWETLPDDVAERLEEVGVCTQCLRVEADCVCCTCVCDCTLSAEQRDAGVECLCAADPECPEHCAEREAERASAPTDDSDDICF